VSADADAAAVHDRLATTALFGTGRRPVVLDEAPPDLAATFARLAGEPPEVLLDAAALTAAYRRAGVTPGTATPPAPAPDDPVPCVPPAAVTRLRELLGRDEPELLRQWLEAAAGRGFRAPHAALPALLDLATTPDGAPAPLRDAVTPLLGTRGRWLATFRPEWAWARPGAGTATGAAGDTRRWELGSPEERLAWLAATRHRDPAGARRALRDSWERETAADRATLLRVLADRLGRYDEELLEAALEDRSDAVRAVAADLLARLPSSGYVARMAGRARAALSRDGDRLAVHPPEPDGEGEREAQARDGLPPAGRRPAAWLEQVIGAAPLAVWDDVLGGPDDAVAAAAAGGGDWRDVVRAGWTRAALRQGSRRWASALVVSAGGDVPPALLELLDDGERAAVVSWLVARAPDAGAGLPALLRLCPAPWPEPLWRAVLRRLAAATSQGPPWRAQPLLQLAGLRFPPGSDASVRAVAAGTRDPAWRVLLTGAADTVAVRTRMLEELT
jgi:hypothetical protein